MASRIGQMRERLAVVSQTPQALSVTAVTSGGTTAVAVVAVPHGFSTGDYAVVAGASPAGYNGKIKITVTSETGFSYSVAAGLSTPATGTITVTYASDAQGGRSPKWRTVDTIAGELLPLRSLERLQLAQLQRVVDYRFRVRVRYDVTASMRLLWTPSGCSSAAARKTINITGITPVDDGRVYMLIDGSEVA